eukprot:jgi/Tetstr1/466607/TSEL_011095.t1
MVATETPPAKVLKVASPMVRGTGSPASRAFGRELTNSPAAGGGSPQSSRQVAKKAPRTGDRRRSGAAALRTPTSALKTLDEDDSLARTQERLQRTHDSLLQKLSQRRKKDIKARETLAHKLTYVTGERQRLTRKLNRSQLELQTRTTATNSALSAMPGAQLDQLESKDLQIAALQEELQRAKERLALSEAGLAKLAAASESCPAEDDVGHARLAELLEAEMKADKANAKVLGTVAEELLAANGLYRSRCAEAEAHVQALQVLNQGKSEVERQQAERIQNLEAELDNARSYSWQHVEQLQQLEIEMRNAHEHLGQQSKELTTKAQLIEHLEARLEAAEEYLEGAQAELESLRPPSGTPSTAPAST